MNENTIDQLVKTLYEMVEDAWSVPLSADKCVVEREKVLDILDELRNNVPNEIRMSKEIVEKRNDYITSAKREAEAIKKQAEEYAKKCVNEDVITAEARLRASEITSISETKAREVMRAASDYCEDAMKRTEEAIGKAFDEIKTSRAQFRAASKK